MDPAIKTLAIELFEDLAVIARTGPGPAIVRADSLRRIELALAEAAMPVERLKRLRRTLHRNAAAARERGLSAQSWLEEAEAGPLVALLRSLPAREVDAIASVVWTLTGPRGLV